MGRQITCLRISIEEMRLDLVKLGEDKPLTDPEVVKLSQRLDGLLNEYQCLRQNHDYLLNHKGA